ncbi:hypothetical protein [Companilactobacillus furfuricola]|uniref:hypothetical protein n=1 Tax=Companilactobacillus furfuricola TaxID=1462575 RepID=UPI000F783A17
MMKGKTKSGFNYLIPEKRLDNYELLEAISDIETNPLIMPKVLKLLFGEEQTEKLKKHLADKEGLVSMEKMTAEIQEIFENQTQVKNS